METSKLQSPEFLWTPFYEHLLSDVAEFSPEIDFDTEMQELATAEELWGTSAYLEVLPKLGKALEISLITCKPLDLQSNLEVKTWHMRDGYPAFLQPLWAVLFYRHTGTSEHGSVDNAILVPRFDMRDKDDVPSNASSAVWALRQYLLAFSKVTDVEPDCEVEDEISKFVHRLRNPNSVGFSRRTNWIIRKARELLAHVLGGKDDFTPEEDGTLCAPLEQWISDPFGMHGPGAVAGGETGKRKWDFDAFEALDTQIYSLYSKHYLDEQHLSSYRVYDKQFPCSRKPYADLKARLAVVPKDFRGHRLICIEPKELQFAQQGIMRVLYERIESHWLTRYAISFRDQMKSQKLSRRMDFATIDLKDASDTISLGIARLLFPKRFFELVTRYRSQSVELPDGRIVESRILATMGNALCFPLETLVFWSLSLATMMWEKEQQINKTLSAYDYNHTKRWNQLRVFGDDIIVPRNFAPQVIRTLEDCGFVVNTQKTCVDGLVREACGSWFYNQSDVRIVRFKTAQLHGTREHAAILEQCRALNSLGMTKTAVALLEYIERIAPVPYGFNGLPLRAQNGIGLRNRDGFQPSRVNGLSGKFYRWNKDLQRLEFRMPTLAMPNRFRDLTGNDGLYAYFTGQATKPLVQGHPSVKWTWVAIN